ncbi:hypothetical protein IFM89_010853 [Coptis chinensis]|uniref:Uncharacterized protein n=1 Tax=Coptis chinensis TaxID=261450 RepID=A0A835I1E1_9MAGN|nr:hypothetical protein IFM89_010853 [Coptis chinensis]
MCITIVKTIKDAVAWPGDIETERDLGAWTGELPNYLRKLHNVNLHEEVSSTGSDTVAPSSDQISTDMETSAQDIASYQVVLSSDGSVVGFQPTSRLAVNHWASNPLAKELYNGRKLTPGLIEPGLKIQQPDKVILVELLMSVNPESWFALARPLGETG